MSTQEEMDERVRRLMEGINLELEDLGITGEELLDEEDDSTTDNSTDDLPNNYDARTGRKTKRERK